MKLLIVNPNTSKPMTEGIAAAARAAAALIRAALVAQGGTGVQRL